jgi:hypothetical protein
MTLPASAERLARAALTYIAEPGDPAMGALLRNCGPAEIVAALTEGRMPVSPVCGSGPASREPDPAAPGPAGLPGLGRALQRWAPRLGEAPAEAALDAWRREGIRLVIPGDAEWPGQLDVLGDARPWGLWVRGGADLRYACLRSVSIVGTRAATAYGAHVCTEMSVALAERGWTIISGGAYGVDGCAHRAALAGTGVTIAVLPGGVDQAYPPGHHGLFQAVLERGAPGPEADSAWLPGTKPGHRCPQPWHRRGGGGVAQRSAEHRAARQGPGPTPDGGPGPGDIGSVGWMSRDHQGLGRCLRNRRWRRDGAAGAARR